MRLLVLCLVGSSVALLGGASTPPAEMPIEDASPARAGDAARGQKLMAQFECARCHELQQKTPVRPSLQCAGCHQRIRAGAGNVGTAAERERWQKNVVHLVDVPALVGLSGRVRRQWIESFLLKPEDVRPGLSESMPRLPLSAQDAADIATALVKEEPDATRVAWPAAATVDKGRALFVQKGCTACHRFGGVVEQVGGAAAAPQAPDLRHTRARMTASSVTAWLRDPLAVKPASKMPRIPLSDDEVLALARFVLEAPLPPNAPQRVPARLPVLSRRVTYDEVRERVFARICVHCHGDAALTSDDGGPGNTGGFGYRGRRLSFSDLASLNAGLVDNDGTRRSVFSTDADGTPRLVRALLARQQEEVGSPEPGVIGMPLGLPSLPPEDIQLIETWIAQGRPRR